MLEDLQNLASQIGWIPALGLAVLFFGDKIGFLSLRIGGKKKSVDPFERLEQRVNDHEIDFQEGSVKFLKFDIEIKELSIKVAKLEAIQDERKPSK